MSFRRKITRRQFIKGAAIAGGAMMMPGLGPFVRKAHAYATSMPLEKFVDQMPMFGANILGYPSPNIPLAKKFSDQKYAGVDYYKLTAGVFRQKLHRDLPNTSQLGVTGTGQRLYGYADHNGNYVHLGGAVLANQGIPVRFSFNSALPASHILPYDTSIPTLENGGGRKDRAAVHLHGGLVPWTSDGGPFHWQSPDPNVSGASVIPWLWDGTYQADGVTPKLVWDYFYPNKQSARLMWYHDHAVGQTRLNAYAGVATGYVLSDGVEKNLALPFGDPIVFQDKVFWDDLNDPGYANYVDGVQRGDLWYPYFYDPAIWPIAPGGTPPDPSAIPEFFGDTMLANGVVFPFHNVNQQTYRFRLLNACNARFLELNFVQENGTTGEPLTKGRGQTVLADVDVTQIGTEGGFLPTPVPLVIGGVPAQPFILGPAERADILVKFNAPGNVILYNVAGSPFPGGAPIFDWYVGNKSLPVPPTAGFGPNTRTIMRFAVSTTKGLKIKAPKSIPVASIPTVIDPVNGGLMVDPATLNAAGNMYTDPFTLGNFAYDPVPVELTLNEVVEPNDFTTAGNTGRLLTLIGNRDPAYANLKPFGAGGTYYFETPSESVQYNSLRIWHLYNFTADAHPMHFHLFNVQILGRRKVNKAGVPTGMAAFPLPNELGFKETVVMYPGEVTIVAALVEDPLPGRTVTVDIGGGVDPVPCTLPYSPRFPGVEWDEYVWHCHILEHEEHDMMRPLIAT